jgi:hypothetical protein
MTDTPSANSPPASSIPPDDPGRALTVADPDGGNGNALRRASIPRIGRQLGIGTSVVQRLSGKRSGSANWPNYLAFAKQVHSIFPLFVVIVVTPRPVVPVVTPRPVVPVVTLRPIIPIVRPLPVIAIFTTSGRVVALLKNRAALFAELRGISP